MKLSKVYFGLYATPVDTFPLFIIQAEVYGVLGGVNTLYHMEPYSTTEKGRNSDTVAKINPDGRRRSDPSFTDETHAGPHPFATASSTSGTLVLAALTQPLHLL